jgi:adenosine 3'-phospho 5'-phosphosulfate transporter B2
MTSLPRDIELANLAKQEKESLLETNAPKSSSMAAKTLETVSASEPSIAHTALEFMFCFLSLQGSYIVWGMMQELIMNTQFNPAPMTPSGHFPSATFCVFSNRFLAIFVSAVACYMRHGTTTSAAPLLSFTPAAISNTLSSWGQYEALDYVSFALQTIFKSTKIIPVMLMGTFLKGTVYTRLEYFEAIGITTGIVIFSMSKSNFASTSWTNEVIGFLLLSLYVLADSFTSQWQSRLYRDYGKIDHFQMMFGVNVSSIIITTM